MWQGGAKRKKILRYLKEVSGKPIMLKDVSNMIAEMRQNSYTSPDDNVHVTKVLQDFSEGPGNVVNVFRDANKLHNFSDGPHETHVLSSEDAVTTETEPLSGTELEKIRYKLFCYVFFGMATRSGK
ncbi:hypothetical protein PC122_g5405 [Phytophthora cactorum]|nr:hypothetical protein PC122_g5405 [Phytophthora cactorum]